MTSGTSEELNAAGASPAGNNTAVVSSNGEQTASINNSVPTPSTADASNNPINTTEPNMATPIPMNDRTRTQPILTNTDGVDVNEVVESPSADNGEAEPPTTPSPQSRGRPLVRDEVPTPTRCINPASDVNARLDTQVEVRVYPCNNSNSSKKKAASSFTIRPEGCLISGNNRNRSTNVDLGSEYSTHIGRKLQRYELSDTRACQLLVTTHSKSFWVVPAPEAFSRHSGTCRLLGDRKHPPSSHTLQVGDFLRVGSVGVVVIETHDGQENRVLSEEKIQKIMKDTTSSNGGFLDLAETDGGKFHHEENF